MVTQEAAAKAVTEAMVERSEGISNTLTTPIEQLKACKPRLGPRCSAFGTPRSRLAGERGLATRRAGT